MADFRRVDRRAHLDLGVRMELLEDDVDTIEKTGAKIADNLASFKTWVIGLMGSVCVACLLLAADIARGR
jgi:hypothetical protein